MLPTRLNLLSGRKQKNLQHTIFAEFTRTGLEILLLVICTAGIFLVGGRYILQSYFNDITETLIISNQKQTKYNHQIKEINNRLQKMEVIQNQFNSWTPILTAISNAIPTNVQLKNMSLNEAASQVYIAGQAKNRTDLLELEMNLEKLEFIDSITLPLSQLTDKENVDFAFTIYTGNLR